MESQKEGINKNKLLRYQAILEYYKEIENPDIPLAVLYRKYIYPKYHISRSTFYEVLRTPIIKLLKAIEANES